MNRKTVLLDIDNTLILARGEYWRLHSRWREVMQYDITLWSSSDYLPIYAELLNVEYISKEESGKPRADVLIDDSESFKLDCDVKEYYKNIDEFIVAQPNWMADAEELFNKIKEDHNLVVHLDFRKTKNIRKAGGGALAICGDAMVVTLDQDTAMNMNKILLHEMAHAICHVRYNDRGHDEWFGPLLNTLEEKYLNVK